MEKLQEVAQIQEKVERRQYRLTSHAEQERESEKITIREIEEAFLSRQAEVIESYPGDVRGRVAWCWGSPKEEARCIWFADLQQRGLSLLQYIVLTPSSG